MVIDTQELMLEVDRSPLRCVVMSPRSPGPFPGIVMYSDIFGLTPSTLRCVARLAGHGFVVLAPEIWHRVEPAGAAFAFDDAGRTRGMADAKKTSVAEIDADCRAEIAALRAHPKVAPSHLGASGFCIGGHFAMRAALQPEIKGTVCFYPTGLHNGELGSDADAKTLERAAEIRGKLLVIFGSADPHVPAEGRAKVEAALKSAGTRFSISMYDAEHAFMRDEGPRYDPAATDQAWAEALLFLRNAVVRD